MESSSSTYSVSVSSNPAHCRAVAKSTELRRYNEQSSECKPWAVLILFYSRKTRLFRKVLLNRQSHSYAYHFQEQAQRRDDIRGKM